MAQMLQKPVFALRGCQRMSVNTLLCDTLGLAELMFFSYPAVSRFPLPPNLPYRTRRGRVAGGIAAQAAFWRVSRYMWGIALYGGIAEIV